MKRKTFGTCALTGGTGQFIKSHLIPRALTRLSKTGEKYIQSEIGGRVTRPSDSWYDLKLVTQTGEDILSDIDSRGIDELKRLRLIWSGCNGQDSVSYLLNLEQGPSFREVRVTDSSSLRLFFLSLLWRAGATKLVPFRYVQLTNTELEELRLRVLRKNPGPAEDFPILLHQITEGAAHNRVPLLEEEAFVNIDGIENASKGVYVRFYFDGLIARIYLRSRTELPEWLMKICIQDDKNILVCVHKFELSRTKDDIVSVITDYTRKSWNSI